MLSDGRIGFQYMNGGKELADFLTKSLDRVRSETPRNDMGVRDC
jgi:hypothetical protein